MKRWIVPLASLAAVTGAVALALFVAGVFDGDEAAGIESDDTEVAGVCVEGNPDCGDTGFVTDDGDTAAPGCEVGHVGVCDDTPIADGETGDLFKGDGPALQPACAPGFPDCADTVVNDNEDGEPVEESGGTSISPLCAPGFPDCEDMIVVPAADGEPVADR
jgi:hypothetical protein